MAEPMIRPHSDWDVPSNFPRLDNSLLSIDLETCDPNLKKTGPGWPFGDGRIAGFAVAQNDQTWYFPTGHEHGPNFDLEMVVKWIKPYLENPEIEKVMFNAYYDLGWLRWAGIKVQGRVHDPMLAAALLDENKKRYNLDSLAREFLGESKDENLLYVAAQAFGLKDAKGEMYKLPPMYVGPYAEQDAILNIRMHEYTQKEIKKQHLQDIYELEIKQLPIIIEMRAQGVRVDIKKAEELGERLLKEEQKAKATLLEVTGEEVDVWSNLSIERAFQSLGLEYEKTVKGNPSFKQSWLEVQSDKISQLILQARKANRARTTFSSGLILDYAKEGRIYAQFNQLKSDDYGTVSGRYSSSTPNLQQIPSRDPEIGPLVRSLFLPEQDHLWGKFDYSQQEPRLTVHYAGLLGLSGSDDAIDYYRSSDHPDYHQMVADMAGIERKKAKTINLGLAYGMGQRKLADSLEMHLDDAKELFGQYHANVPFVKSLTEAASRKATQSGYVKTLLGRRCRFPYWEPQDWDLSREMTPMLDQEQMLLLVNRYRTECREKGIRQPRPGVKRAHTYRAMNRLIQGSAADMTKKAMVDVFQMGYTPMIQVHDELNFSVTEPRQVAAIKEIMENCVQLLVPIKVDAEIGTSWGDVSKDFKWS